MRVGVKRYQTCPDVVGKGVAPTPAKTVNCYIAQIKGGIVKLNQMDELCDRKTVLPIGRFLTLVFSLVAVTANAKVSEKRYGSGTREHLV